MDSDGLGAAASSLPPIRMPFTTLPSCSEPSGSEQSPIGSEGPHGRPFTARRAARAGETVRSERGADPCQGPAPRHPAGAGASDVGKPVRDLETRIEYW